MTTDEMRMVAKDCEAIARLLADRQDTGAFAPVVLGWTGVLTCGANQTVGDMAVVSRTPDEFKGVLTVGGVKYVVAGKPEAAPKPVYDPHLTHRIVNAMMSSANTFHFLANGGTFDAPADTGK